MAPHVGYFSIQPQPYIHDPMANMRYGMPPGMYDPRMQLSGGRHKKVCALSAFSFLGRLAEAREGWSTGDICYYFLLSFFLPWDRH